MGFHIVNIKDGKLEHAYIEREEDLAHVSFITDDSIIYQGEERWTPCKVSEHDTYKNYAKDKFRAGIKAQALFKKQAAEQGFMLEELNQDQNSFKAYTSSAENVSIKRGDFMIRNCANIEIDVKCLTFYPLPNNSSEKCFDFKCEDATKHKNMQDFTKTPILIAVYKRSDDNIADETVRMIAIDKIVSNENIKTRKKTTFKWIEKENPKMYHTKQYHVDVQQAQLLEQALAFG